MTNTPKWTDRHSMDKLTPEEQQQVDQAAIAEARLHFHPVYSKDQFTACRASFTAGIDYALQHLLPLRMKGFAEWVQYQSVQNPEETLKRYLQHIETLKQKEDEI